MEVSKSASHPGRFTPGKEPYYPLDRSLGGPQSPSGRGGEEKNSQPLPRLEPPSSRPQPSAIPLSYPRSCAKELIPQNGKGKLKLSLCLTKHHAMKAYWGSGA
jgi:hypothetical protein